MKILTDRSLGGHDIYRPGRVNGRREPSLLDLRCPCLGSMMNAGPHAYPAHDCHGSGLMVACEKEALEDRKVYDAAGWRGIWVHGVGGWWVPRLIRPGKFGKEGARNAYSSIKTG